MVDATVFNMFSRKDKTAVPADFVSPEPDSPAAPIEPVGPHISVSQPEPPVPFDCAHWPDLPVGHDLVSLANPAGWTVRTALGQPDAIEMSADATGIYRPLSFRAAPWSGFSYDVSPDRRSGLVAGSMILTSRGEVAVEHLIPGDTVMALRGPALLPLLWIGRSTADQAPVLIEAGALGAGRPSRALCVGPEQPIFVDPVPVAAQRLINGTTIRTLSIEAADLFHVDVGRQEVLFAQNLAIASAMRPHDASTR